MAIDRCICHQISFSEILKIAEEKGLNNLENLRSEKICSCNCKLCEPYIKESLKTGKTSFTVNAFIEHSRVK